jgi:ribonuclease VapC
LIVVDTSAVFAVLYAEPMGPACAAALAGDDALLASAGTLAEMGVVAARSGFTTVLERFLERLRIEIAPVDAAMAESVGRAYQRWGKGIHTAKLNFGDCFAYTLAKERGLPLLFVGNDFAQTDVTPALR